MAYFPTISNMMEQIMYIENPPSTLERIAGIFRKAAYISDPTKKLAFINDELFIELKRYEKIHSDIKRAGNGEHVPGIILDIVLVNGLLAMLKTVKPHVTMAGDPFHDHLIRMMEAEEEYRSTAITHLVDIASN